MRIVFSLVLSAFSAAAQNYVQDVYPIWEKHCLGCHASGTKMGSLDIETWEGIERGGNHGTILVPGDIKASRLYTMLIGETKPAMPMDGQVLSAAEIEIIRKWIAAGAQPPTAAEIVWLQRKAAGEESVPAVVNPQIFSLAARPGTTEMAVGRFQTVDLLDPATNHIRATFTGHAGEVRALAFSNDGQRLAAAGGVPGAAGEVIIWDAESKAVLTRIKGHPGVIQKVIFSTGGQLIATGDGRSITVWDAATGREASTFSVRLGGIYALAFTPDGRLAVAAADGLVGLWNPVTGERLFTLSGPARGITALAISPDGRRVAVADLDHIRIWELNEKARTLRQPSMIALASTTALAWSPDGTRIVASGAGRTLTIFEVAGLTLVKSLPGGLGRLSSFAFTADSATIAVGSFDGTLALVAK